MKHRCEICGGLTYKPVAPVKIGHYEELRVCGACVEALKEIITSLQKEANVQ